MKSELRAYWDGLLHLLYPQLCPACGDTLPVGVALLCLTCQQTLPETGFHEQAENTFTERFAGRVALAHGTALYYFSKGTRVQRLIHQLKYKQKREIGYQLGRYYGLQLRGDPNYQSLTGIVPVPLHPRKLHQRGYNQAELFAEGLATAMDLPYWPTALIRHTYSSS
ncbi:MAG: ComF family protein, partial [Bacteroidetes bacterium]